MNQDELKKFEKVLKKEKNDMEELRYCSNIKQVHDKIIKTITNMRKMTKENNKIIRNRQKLNDEKVDCKNQI